MKKLCLVPLVIIIISLSYPLHSFADYIIHLNSGRQFVTDRYWKEDREVKLGTCPTYFLHIVSQYQFHSVYC